ncbi:MAG: sugar phosphate isomerase/epimerase family protein [Saprospiraceae bacterium]
MIKFIIMVLTITTYVSCKNAASSSADTKIEAAQEDTLKISLAQWSFHLTLEAGKMDHLDFAPKAAELGFEGVEYVNKFFKDKATDLAYLDKMNQVAAAAGVKQLLIMIDSEGDLGDTNDSKREEAVNNHYKWVDAAAYLGCHSIRVNAAGMGKAEEVASSAVKGLSKLAEYAATKGINVIVENHGGYSSDGTWLSGVIKKVNMPNCGTLPDFGNFCIKKEKVNNVDSCVQEYDRYKGVEELMPYAKAVSAKSFDFGEMGFETTIDYFRMMDIIKAAGYSGYIGVEYEGKTLSEEDGVKATKSLIEKCLEKKE